MGISKRCTLRFANYLAPRMEPVYRRLAECLARRLGVAATLETPPDYEHIGTYDVSFVCGLAYVVLADEYGYPLVPVAAPVYEGSRYKNRPVYFSDIVVHRQSRYRTLDDLRGCRWAYNEPLSQSGYGIACYWLARRRRLRGFFRSMIRTGYHDRSLEMVASGRADAAAIDSHLLGLYLRDYPDMTAPLRVIGTLGPSTSQPVTVSGRLPAALREDLQQALLTLHDAPAGRELLTAGLIHRFAAVDDRSYNDLRRMRQAYAGRQALTGT